MRISILAAMFIYLFYSFSANSMSVEDTQKYCKGYASQGFEMKNTGDLLCANTIKTIMDMGYLNCGDLQKHIKKRGKEGATVEELSGLYAIVSGYANDKISIQDGVVSFLKWADKNPNLGKTNIVEHAYAYLSQPFPCKIID